MLRQGFYRLAFSLTLLLITAAAFSAVKAQEKTASDAPQLSVIGVKLGDRATAKTYLDGYAPRDGEDGRPTYYFYNGYATQILKLTAGAPSDPYFITEIEVFGIDDRYQKRHYQDKKNNYFMTEKGIFIGYKQSVASMLTFPGVTRSDIIGPKDVVKKIGEPSERSKNTDNETFIYNHAGAMLTIQDATGKSKSFGYSARYEFYKNQLVKFVFKITPAGEKQVVPDAASTIVP